MMLSILPLLGQDTLAVAEEEKTPLLQVNGYLKQLGSINFDNQLQNAQYDNLIHNRLNSVWTFSPKLQLNADLRTRIFNGYTVQNNPLYADLLDQDLAWQDMSWVLHNGENTIIHSTIDRLYLSYLAEKWQLSVGRQRINWGRTFVWNPNDLFNTYSYLDFDYEERPGADALRFQYFMGYASGFEIAYAPGDTWDESVAALMLKLNRWNYDFQILLANYHEELAFGGAWAGDLWGIGFKGEMSYFYPRRDLPNKPQNGYLNASVSLDYAFANGLYLQGEFLYNGAWQSQLNPAVLLLEPLPANNLFPARTVGFLSVSYPVHPLLTLSYGSIFSPNAQMYIQVPSLTFSLRNNLDLYLVAQLLRNPSLEALSPMVNAGFFRLKWSF